MSAPTTERPATPAPPSPGLSPVELLRWSWRQLTSMRTALLLLLLLTGSQVLFNRLDHFVAHFRGLCEARAKVVLDLLELLAVAFCVAERDAVRPVLWL